MFLFEGNYSVAFVPLADRPCPIFLFPSLLFCLPPFFFLSLTLLLCFTLAGGLQRAARNRGKSLTTRNKLSRG